MKISQHIFLLAEKIYKCLGWNASVEEKHDIKEWEGASAERSELVDRLSETASYREKQQLYRSFDPYYDWNKLRRAIVRRKNHRVLFRLSTAAVILLLISLGSLYWAKVNVKVEPTVFVSALVPGRSVAVLTLADGSKKELAEEQFVISASDVVVENRNNSLRYNVKDSVVPTGREVYNEIYVPRGGEYHLVLSDGSQVWINSETKVKYPVEFKGPERKIYISGEAYVKVVRNESQPFMVKTDDFVLQVLGTEFNIRTYRDEKASYATLVKGSISIKDESGSCFKLKPSEQLSYDKQQRVSYVKPVQTDLFTSWKEGMYIFEKQRLEDVLSIVSRWYDLTFFYVNADVKDISFSGRVKRYEDGRVLLNLFEQLGGIKFQVNGKTVTVGES